MSIKINGNTYQAGKMAPREQLHVLRRLTPLLTEAAPALMGFLDGSKDKGETIRDAVAAIGPLADALAKMPDGELDYVMDHCLLQVQRQDAKTLTWHPAYAGRGGELVSMYSADIDLATELRLVSEVVKVNLAGFFGALGAGAASLPSAP